MSARGHERFESIAGKVLAGERISTEDAEALFAHNDLPALGALADTVRRLKHPDPIVTYVVGCNLNYTNVCWVRCKFCAFVGAPGRAVFGKSFLIRRTSSR